MKNMSKYGVALVAALIGTLTLNSIATVLSADRDTPMREGEQLGIAQASNVLYAGALVAVDTNGAAVPAGDVAGYNVIGRAAAQYDNTAASYSAGATCVVERGTFLYVNGGTFTDANIGDFAYALDDQTVFTASQATNDILAGIIVDVDEDGVWIDTLAAGGQGAVSLASLTVSGAGSISGQGTFGTAVATTFLTSQGRRVVLGADGTNSVVIETGTATNGQIVSYTTPFTGAPKVLVNYAAYVATNAPSGASSVNPTSFVANGTATLTLNWFAVGTK